MIPCLILFAAAQKYFVENIAMTGGKCRGAQKKATTRRLDGSPLSELHIHIRHRRRFSRPTAPIAIRPRLAGSGTEAICDVLAARGLAPAAARLAPPCVLNALSINV